MVIAENELSPIEDVQAKVAELRRSRREAIWADMVPDRLSELLRKEAVDDDALCRLKNIQVELAGLFRGLKPGTPEMQARLVAIRAGLSALETAKGKPDPFGPGLLDEMEAEWWDGVVLTLWQALMAETKAQYRRRLILLGLAAAAVAAAAAFILW